MSEYSLAKFKTATQLKVNDYNLYLFWLAIESFFVNIRGLMMIGPPAGLSVYFDFQGFENMDKVNRSRRAHFIMQYIPAELTPEIGLYFGEHVVRINQQLCLVVNGEGELGIRALHPALASELNEVCSARHWVAHGREYEQWYLIPESLALNDVRVQRWITQAANEVYRLSLISAIPNRQLK